MPHKNKEDYNAWKRKNYLKNREKELERKRVYNSTDEAKHKRRERRKKTYELRKDKIKAKAKANYALKRGRIERKDCVDCGAKSNLQMHHSDYSKPLDVTWLCRSCHMVRHRKGV